MGKTFGEIKKIDNYGSYGFASIASEKKHRIGQI